MHFSGSTGIWAGDTASKEWYQSMHTDKSLSTHETDYCWGCNGKGNTLSIPPSLLTSAEHHLYFPQWQMHWSGWYRELDWTKLYWLVGLPNHDQCVGEPLSSATVKIRTLHAIKTYYLINHHHITHYFVCTSCMRAYKWRIPLLHAQIERYILEVLPRPRHSGEEASN